MKNSLKLLRFAVLIGAIMIFSGCTKSQSSFYGIVPSDYQGLVVVTHLENQPNDFLEFLPLGDEFLTFLKGEWSFIAAIGESGEVVAGLKSERAAEIEELLLGKNLGMTIRRENEVLVFAKTEEDAERAFERIEKGAAAELNKKGFGYLEYRNELLGKIKMDVQSDEKGLKVEKFYEGDQVNEFFSDYVPVIFEKIPLANPVIYAEEPFLVPPVLNDGRVALYLSKISASIGVELTEIRQVVSSPFAFALGEANGFLPDLSFYFQLDDESKDAGRNIVFATNTYLEEVLMEFSAIFPGGQSLLTKETVLLNGAGVYKITVNLAALSEAFLGQLSAVPGLLTQPVEIYFGLSSDNLLFVSMYGDFVNEFGKSLLKDSDVFANAMGDLSGDFVEQLHFVNLAALTRLSDKYLGSVFVLGKVPKEMTRAINFAKGVLEPFAYSIGTLSNDDGEVFGEQFLSLTK